MPEEFTIVTDWARLYGIWGKGPDPLTYLGVDDTLPHITAPQASYGMILSGVKFDSGKVRTTISLSSDKDSGRILLGYSPRTSRYLTVGLGGGEGEAYDLSEFAPGIGWLRLAGSGQSSDLEIQRPYPVEVRLDGQRIRLQVDGIKVIDHILREPLSREQAGLFAWGIGPVGFGPVEISSDAPSAFVVTEFTGQFNELYEDVIQPVCAELGVAAYRVSDIYRPGVILQDIIQGLTESHVVIVEITPPNPNVFYDLGYSHALHKPTILLADREATTLPFDLSGYRVIFYDNTIRGKGSVEADLRQHLAAILGE